MLIAFALAVVASSAPAATVTERTELFSFNGSDTTAGAFGQPSRVEIDQANGIVYVIDQGKQRLDKFNLAGEAQNFAATGESSLATGFTFTGNSDIAVDSSPVNTGRIYVSRGAASFSSAGGPVKAFSLEGSSLWELPSSSVGAACGLAVDVEGHLWVGTGGKIAINRYSNTGSPPGLVDLISTGPEQPCRLAIDQSSQNVYAGVSGTKNRLKKYVKGIFDSTLLDNILSIADITIDQSKAIGHLFLLSNQASILKEFDASGKELNEYPYIGSGIAYSPSLDRLYIADFNAKVVRVLGPPVTGEAPDVTIDPVQSNSVTTADFSGTINPLGLQNSYYFEYKADIGASWAAGKKTPAGSITPTDNTVHPVSASIGELEANKEYQVRLVGENTALKLKSFSPALTFKTGKAAVVSIDPPTGVTTSTADVSGSVDPGDSEASWRFQLSSHSECLSGKGFVNRPAGAIAANAGPTTVGEELTGLLPSQEYCVRISATNNPGESLSAIETFTTEPVAPTDLITAFAAPRTDTTARLNGRVNPQGEDLTYRFEWSEDGGSTWNALPDQEETSGTHQEVILSQELTGLDPSTTYSYRFSAENAIGGTQGAVKSFTTRTTAEMNPPSRALELVNRPDKGPQHVLTVPLEDDEVRFEDNALSADGEQAGWSVLGGAPGGTSGSGNPFLATRGPNGWTSESMIPPAEDQFGGGELKFDYVASSPDFGRSLFTAYQYVFVDTDVVLVRDSGEGPQEVLGSWVSANASNVSGGTDTTTDLQHAVLVDPKTGLLTDYGTGSPEVVGLLEDDEPPACGITDLDNNFYQSGVHWIATTDASRVYFETRGDNCSDPVGLYVRNRAEGTTTQLAADADFQRTSADGTTALFTTPEALTGEDENSHIDLYRHSEGAPVECLSCASGLSVGGQVRVAKDLSRTYFTSGNQLHVLREDGSSDFIAEVKGGHIGSIFVLGDETSAITPDGRVLLFISTTRPTTDEFAVGCITPGAATPHPCIGLYRYDDADGSVECISCKQDGLTTEDFRFNSYGLALSADGSTAAFVTFGALVPEDVNKVADVYEWRNGVHRLVTDGETKFSPQLENEGKPTVRGIDASGQGILFSVAAGSLTGWEQDGLSNLYVARIGGGFDPPAPPLHCAEDSCQGPLQPPPASPPPASSNYQGAGNLKSQPKTRKPCARKRGKAKRRCLKRQRVRANAKAGRGK